VDGLLYRSRTPRHHGNLAAVRVLLDGTVFAVSNVARFGAVGSVGLILILQRYATDRQETHEDYLRHAVDGCSVRPVTGIAYNRHTSCWRGWRTPLVAQACIGHQLRLFRRYRSRLAYHGFPPYFVDGTRPLFGLAMVAHPDSLAFPYAKRWPRDFITCATWKTWPRSCGPPGYRRLWYS